LTLFRFVLLVNPLKKEWAKVRKFIKTSRGKALPHLKHNK